MGSGSNKNFHRSCPAVLGMLIVHLAGEEGPSGPCSGTGPALGALIPVGQH